MRFQRLVQRQQPSIILLTLPEGPIEFLRLDAAAPLQSLANRHGWSLLPKPVNPERLRSLVVELTRRE